MQYHLFLDGASCRGRAVAKSDSGVMKDIEDNMISKSEDDVFEDQDIDAIQNDNAVDEATLTVS